MAQSMNFDVVRCGNSEDCFPHCSCGRVAASVLQNPVIDDLGLCAVLEGCRELRKLSLAHVHAGDRVMHMLATKSKQLEVRASSLKVLRLSRCQLAHTLGLMCCFQGVHSSQPRCRPQ